MLNNNQDHWHKNPLNLQSVSLKGTLILMMWTDHNTNEGSEHVQLILWLALVQEQNFRSLNRMVSMQKERGGSVCLCVGSISVWGSESPGIKCLLRKSALPFLSTVSKVRSGEREIMTSVSDSSGLQFVSWETYANSHE